MKANTNQYNFSVLLSVYYKEKPNYLIQALDSVFNQSLTPNEVVLVEDGSLTDDLNKVISEYEKKYNNILKVIKFEHNRGLGVALHDGLLKCSNEIVFRMDTDDICDLNRFAKQIDIFKKMDVDVVGSNIVEYDENMENITSYRVVPENDKDIKKMAKKRNPINHVTVGFKKSKVISAGNYQDMMYFEDYYLWARMIKNGCIFYNVQDNLVSVRGGNDMIKRRGGRKYIKPILNFEKSIKKINIINGFEYLINIGERITVSLIPNNFRYRIYKKALRK